MVVAAACRDPRFPPLEPDELAEVVIEISVLSDTAPLAPADAAWVVVGRDGLIVRRGARVGLLLPQVASQYGWEPDEFLVAACRKAGLPDDAWRDSGTEVRTFRAEVFGE
jgi:AmmeMemoRadiSam system protein A